jgi:hypothetical protein
MNSMLCGKRKITRHMEEKVVVKMEEKEKFIRKIQK